MAISPETKKCIVVLHDGRVSKHNVLVGPGLLPPGAVATLQGAGTKVLVVNGEESTSGSNEISLHISLGEQFGFENRMPATLTILESSHSVTATHVEFTFKDQHLSRADIWRLMRELDRTVIYCGQTVRFLGSPAATVQAIHIAGKANGSAIASQVHTRPIFRSESARFTILVQISKEMLDYWDNGSLMYERLISGYLTELFMRWEAAKARHQVTIVVFGRILPECRMSTSHNVCDFYHVLEADVPSVQWQHLLRVIKRAFHHPHLPRQVTLAADGNMIEAFHLAVMDFMEENVDFRLNSRGSSIIGITAGAGFFNAGYSILKRTTHLLMGNSIGVDLVSLSHKPFYSVPLFRYKQDDQIKFALPHWLDISYWTEDGQLSTSGWVGMENEANLQDVKVEYLSSSGAHNYDEQALCGRVPGTSRIIALEQKAETDSPKLESSTDQHTALKPTNSALSASLHQRQSSSSSDAKSDTIMTMDGAELSDSASAVSPLRHTPVKTRSKNHTAPHPLLKMGRTISLGPKGMLPGRGSAIATVSTEHAGQGRDLSVSNTPRSGSSSGLAKQIRASLNRKPSESSIVSQVSPTALRPTRPIDIQPGYGTRLPELENLTTLADEQANDDALHGQTVKPDASLSHLTAVESVSSLQQQLAPWVTLLNPSNPRRDNMQVASQYRKWQHVFPKAVSSKAFKWASMCSPAVLPLTSEYCPTQVELEKDYRIAKRHIVALRQIEALGHRTMDDLLDDLITIRLNRGFQIVLDKRKTQTGHTDINRAFLVKGNRYHELQRLSSEGIDVIQYELKADVATERAAEQSPAAYRARIRPLLASKATEAEIDLAHTSSRLDWTKVDQQLVDDSLGAEVTRISRIRLVLIPLEISRTSAIGTIKSKELTDDERRIDGIQRLTQLWQRHRHFTAEDRSHHASFVRPKAAKAAVERDLNPLSVEYQTRDPSVVARAYGPSLTSQKPYEESAAAILGESEVYHTSNFDVSKLAKHMQNEPPSGIEVKDRRWLTRTHVNCFRGDEMVNWLLRVFKDLSLREDAVAIGNELMKRGIFTHVRHKHEFRDGNYFYQIVSSHRTTEYPDTHGLFGKVVGKSVLQSPSAETRHSPSTPPARRDSDSSSSRPTPSSAPVERKQLMLSALMQYNVDDKKLSDSVEIINLHYDRLHNPENCYHIQLDWMEATAKLVNDAIRRWASLAEGYGLKLVQIPMAEASKLRDTHVFDQPYLVKLARPPPSKVRATPRSGPVNSPPVEEHIAYHKAILRKMDFVLDLEAASSFQGPLDVRYSWGKPEYSMTQFVHRSGTLLAQIMASDQADFLLVPNRLGFGRPFGTHNKTETVPVVTTAKEFRAFCHDAKALGAFYDEMSKARTNLMSPLSNTSVLNDQDIPPMQLPPHIMHRIAS